MVEDILKLDFKIIGVVTPMIEYPNINYLDTILKEPNQSICKLKDINLYNLTSADKSKLDLYRAMDNDLIYLNDFSKGLNEKEINYFKRLFKKLVKIKNKKIIIVSRDIEFLVKVCDTIAVYQKKIIYFTKDMFDDKLYKYVDMPMIVKFIKYSNQKGAKLKPTLDRNELIKDIYRRKNEI